MADVTLEISSKAAALDLPHAYAVVSINDFGDPCPVKRRWGLQDVLSLEFMDVGEGQMAMTPEQAREVWTFVRGLPSEVETLVIHCFAGVSRSISTAFAIADVLGMGRTCIRWVRQPAWGAVHHDPPNRHVYRLVREAGEGKP